MCIIFINYWEHAQDYGGVEFASRDSVMARVSTIEQHNYLMYLNEFKFKKKVHELSWKNIYFQKKNKRCNFESYK